MQYLKKITRSMLIVPFVFMGQSSFANNIEKKTYLPEYRMNAFFGTGFSEEIPAYSMAPFHNEGKAFNSVLPVRYEQSSPLLLLSQFDELIYFTIRIDESGKIVLDERDELSLNYLQRLPNLYGTKLSLAIAGPSDTFMPAIENEAQYKDFLFDLESILVKYTVSTLDLDWEFPRNEEEKEAHLKLLKDLRIMADRLDIELSMAVSRHRPLIEESYDLVDTINLMAYDMMGRHSTPEAALEALEYMLIRYKLSPEKVSLGLPFYGRIFDGFSPDYFKKSSSYREIVENFPQEIGGDEAGGFYFNGPATLIRKMDMAADHKIKGIFLWEIGQDIFDENSISSVVIDY